MATYDLLVIDPQNDFMDTPQAALPVPGANADMQRLADWLQLHASEVDSMTVTMDSHASFGVERTTFWLDAQGQSVAPFTVVTAADVAAGTFHPRHTRYREEVLQYLHALEASGQRHLVVWPVHCVLGTWGHNIHGGLSDAIAHWEQTSGKMCNKVIKGLHPLTEQYSAFRAEVPRADEVRTQLNQKLMYTLASGSHPLLVAGEALSHCVAASVDDMLAYLPAARLQQIVLLTDCMSPVSGFEDMGQAFLQRARANRMHTATLPTLASLTL